MGRSKEELVAVFIRERTKFDNDDGSRVIIADATDGAMQQITLKGEADYGELKTGMKYLFYGIWRNHEKYGEQFWFDNFREADVGKDKESIVTFLVAKRIPGIGLQKAKKLFDTFGGDTLDVLRDDPERVTKEVSSIGLPTARTAAGMLKSRAKSEQIKAELLSFTKGLKLKKKVIDELIRDHGGKAVEAIKEDPFMLLQYKGVGFATADKIWHRLEYDPKDIRRQAYALHYELTQSSDGDIWVQRPVLLKGLAKHISGSNPRRDEAITAAIENQLLAEKTMNKAKWYADGRLAFLEERCSAITADLAIREAIWPAIDKLPLSEHQMAELTGATSKHVGVFSGSPGTGKTYSITLLIRALQEAGFTAIVLTPTGKAAVRAKEAFDQADVACDAVTAYSYLGFTGNGFRGVEAAHDFLICDEWSMADISLHYEVLRCLTRETRVLFVGDVYQLPPVGPGAPFRDMIESGIVPCGMLTEIRRNSGDIVKCCASIRDEQKFTYSKEIDIEKGWNLQFIEAANSEAAVNQVMAFYKSPPVGLPGLNSLDMIWDVQVIAATNNMRKELNALLQKKLNPDGEVIPNSKTKTEEFRMGDKVICTSNSEYLGQEMLEGRWMSLIEPGHGSPTRYKVANGEQGEIIGHDTGKMIVRVLSPTRIISVPMRKPKDEDDAGSKSAWDLGYAITCHRSQGSEWLISVEIVDSAGAAKRIQTMNWLITAISRTKVYGVVIGDLPTIKRVAKTPGLDRRTFLKEDIQHRYETMLFSDRIREFTDDDFADLLEGI